MENNLEEADLRKILLIGGGGHCRSVLDCIIASGEYDDIGIVDKDPVELNGAIYAGSDEELPDLFEKGWNEAFVTLGSIGSTVVRRRLSIMLDSIGFNMPEIGRASCRERV